MATMESSKVSLRKKCSESAARRRCHPSELYTKPHMPGTGLKKHRIRKASVMSPNKIALCKSFTASWLPDMDLNHDKQIQSLLCYRYTIGQTGACDRLDAFPGQSSRQTVGGSKAKDIYSRPHPGPLPRERGNHSPAFKGTRAMGCSVTSGTNNRGTVVATGAILFARGARSFSLSRGERAGVRASVTTKFRVLPS